MMQPASTVTSARTVFPAGVARRVSSEGTPSATNCPKDTVGVDSNELAGDLSMALSPHLPTQPFGRRFNNPPFSSAIREPMVRTENLYEFHSFQPRCFF